MAEPRPVVQLDGEGQEYLLSLVYKARAFTVDTFNSDDKHRFHNFRQLSKVLEELTEIFQENITPLSQTLEQDL